MYKREKPFCTNVASHSAPNQFTILSIYKKLISSSPRRWLVSERTVCSCTLRPRSWLLPGCCQYEYICDFLLYWYIFVMILYQYIDKWLPYLWYRVTVKNSNHNVFFKFVLFKRIMILGQLWWCWTQWRQWKQKRTSHLNDAASNCGGSHGFSVRQTSTMIKSAAILSQCQWSSEVPQFYCNFHVMIKSAAILTNINDDQQRRILS